VLNLSTNDDEITERVIGCAIKVHQQLGPGLLESAYTICLEHKLIKSGLKVEREKPVSLNYDDLIIDCAYRVDLLVEDANIIEIKSVEKFEDVHLAQLITYLRLTECEVGLIINFNVKLLKNGLRRVVNNYDPT
jgi:GxxExxY protein